MGIISGIGKGAWKAAKYTALGATGFYPGGVVVRTALMGGVGGALGWLGAGDRTPEGRLENAVIGAGLGALGSLGISSIRTMIKHPVGTAKGLTKLGFAPYYAADFGFRKLLFNYRAAQEYIKTNPRTANLTVRKILSGEAQQAGFVTKEDAIKTIASGLTGSTNIFNLGYSGFGLANTIVRHPYAFGMAGALLGVGVWGFSGASALVSNSQVGVVTSGSWTPVGTGYAAEFGRIMNQGTTMHNTRAKTMSRMRFQSSASGLTNALHNNRHS